MSINVNFPELFTVKIKETSSIVEINADITGFSTENITVTPWQKFLVIELNTELQEPSSYYLGDCEVNRLRRSIPLEFDIGDADIDSQSCSGTLTVKIAKPKTTNADIHQKRVVEPA
jgi:HSP20 family molecular chaperone IbpA